MDIDIDVGVCVGIDIDVDIDNIYNMMFYVYTHISCIYTHT